MSTDETDIDPEQGLMASIFGGSPTDYPPAPPLTDAQKSKMAERLGRLDEQERLVLGMRLGLDDGVPKSDSEIGRQTGLTSEQIDDLEQKAVAKLNRPS